MIYNGYIGYVLDDGGRGAAGYKGWVGDCVVRAVAIATEQPYKTVHDEIGALCRAERKGKRARKRGPDNGVSVKRQWFKEYMARLGWKFTPTMSIGSGCQVHMRDNELPRGRIIVSLSKHYCAVIDGVIHDLSDPSRDGTRCVYGYWSKNNLAEERNP